MTPTIDVRAVPSGAAAVSRRHCNLLGAQFDLVSYADVLAIIEQWHASGISSYIAVANPHSVRLAQHDPEMRAALEGAGLTIPDGIGVVIAARILGYPNSGRVAGPTLVLKVCDAGRRPGYRHFFYGGREGIAERMAENLSGSFPGLQVAGCFSPPFRQATDGEDQETVARINATRPDIVWVGLGAPKQEKWMAAHAGRIRCTAMLGVGAAFDFHSGSVPWAPRWMRELGLEWVHRVAREPARVVPKALDGARLVMSAMAQGATRVFRDV